MKEEDRRRSKEEKPPCECGPVLERIGASIEKDRVGANIFHFSDVVLAYSYISRPINFQVEILKHIDLNNGRMETRLEAFEKKTKAAMFNFNQVLIHFTHNVHDNGHSFRVVVNVHCHVFRVNVDVHACHVAEYEGELCGGEKRLPRADGAKVETSSSSSSPTSS